jgi:hypothetical protein
MARPYDDFFTPPKGRLQVSVVSDSRFGVKGKALAKPGKEYELSRIGSRFEYSSVAGRTPPLAPGLTALDMIRQTLDRYLSGMKAYGMAGYTPNDPTTRYDYMGKGLKLLSNMVCRNQ